MGAGEARSARQQKGANGARGQRFRAAVLHSYDVMAHYANATHWSTRGGHNFAGNVLINPFIYLFIRNLFIYLNWEIKKRGYQEAKQNIYVMLEVGQCW